jgi:hypothetical protein
MATEKKIEILTKSGKVIRVMPHMLNDFARFEATTKRPAIKNTPKELLNIPDGAKKTILPKMEVTPLPDAKIPDEVKPEVKVRKTPVRSKAKK